MEKEAPPHTQCTSFWVLDELQFMLEPPPTTLPHHLVLETARELPAEDQQWLIQALKEEEAPQDPAPDTTETPQDRQLKTLGTHTEGATPPVPEVPPAQPGHAQDPCQ